MRPACNLCLCALVVNFFTTPLARAQQNPIDVATAAPYFREAQEASERDHGALWGVPLYGPLLFADPETRSVVANQADKQGKLQPKDGVFVGKLPPESTLGNTATTWAGVKWTMVLWPLPQYHQERVRLLMHECFHRIEPEMGLKFPDSPNNHLDTLDGRIWLEMEWRALEQAIWKKDGERRRAIEDALYFRNFRRSLSPNAAAAENALELNEGLAEYTGAKLSAASMAEFAVLADVALRRAYVGSANFVRSFAYTSGLAYGFLLDASGSNWRASLASKSNLGESLRSAYRIQSRTVDRAEAIHRAKGYDGEEVIAIEARRQRRREDQIASARKRFIEGPVLILPVGNEFNYSFDPNAVVAVDDSLTLYNGNVQVSDAWGILHSSEGVLMVRRGGLIVRVQVPAPSDPAKGGTRPIKGDRWTIDLKAGWTVAPASRPGDLTLHKGSP